MSEEGLDKFAGFHVLPVVFPPIHFLEIDSSSTPKQLQTQTRSERSVEHHIFFRKNSIKDDSLPENKTLFLVNIPADSSFNHLRRLFRRCGTVERVVFRKDKMAVEISNTEEDNLKDYWKSGACCHVIFMEDDAVQKALSMKKRKRVWTDKSEDIEDNQVRLYGWNKWQTEYQESRPALEDVEKRVNQYMQEFDAAEKQRRQEELAKRNLPDEDGFVTVTRVRGRRNTNKDPGGAVVGAIRKEKITKLKPKKKELSNFYRFQMRETKRQELADLRTKFEQDKKKIEAMKSARKFKPY